MDLVLTAFFAGLNAMLLLWLSVRVVGRRQSGQVSLGDGGDRELQKRIRAHANAAEYIPIGLVLLGLTEALGSPAWVVILLGVLLSFGRAVHAAHFAGLLPGMQWRVAGMSATFSMIALAAIGLLGHALFRAV